MNKAIKIFIISVIVFAICFIILYQVIYADQLLFHTPDGPMWYNPVLERWEEVTTYYNTNPFNVSNTTVRD